MSEWSCGWGCEFEHKSAQTFQTYLNGVVLETNEFESRSEQTYLNGVSHVDNNDVVFPRVGNRAAVVAEQLVRGELDVQLFVEVGGKENCSGLSITAADPCYVIDFYELRLQGREVVEADHVLQVVFSGQDVLEIMKLNLQELKWLEGFKVKC